jgi:hypothetical protein
MDNPPFMLSRLVASALCAWLALVATGYCAEIGGQYGPVIAATNKGFVGRPILRTPDDRARDADIVPTSPEAPGVVVNSPTIPLEEYNALKATMAAMANSSASEKTAPVASGPYISTRGVNFTGAVEGENSINKVPPDVDGAVGLNQVVQTTNSSVDVWSKVTSETPTHINSFSENSLVGSTDSLGDGRVLYDFAWNRWVILIDDFSNLSNSGKTEFFLAISQTSDAAGSYFIFPISMNTSPAGCFLIFPSWAWTRMLF